MEMPALHNYGRMPRIAPQIVEAAAIPEPWKPARPRLGRRLAMSSEPRGSLRRIIGISVAVTLTLLIFIMGGTWFAVLLENSGIMLGFVAAVFVASVVAGYFVSGVSLRRVVAG
jgi:hypothetical protein